MISRIVGKGFTSQEELDKYNEFLEEAKERDHRKIGQDLDLFCFSDYVGAGLPLYTPRGTIVKDELQKEIERVCKKLFNSTMFNFACLMNNAYRDNEKPHVHFQFIPRYNGERVILNKKYKDKHFGYNLWKWALNKFKSQKDIFNKEEKIKIFEMMKNEFMKNK